MYLFDIAPIERNVVQQLVREGLPVPDTFTSPPELRPGLELFLDAFFDLDSERQSGTPIPWRAMRDYAIAYGFTEEQTNDLFFFVRALDEEHLTRQAKQAKQAATKNGAKSRSARPIPRRRR